MCGFIARRGAEHRDAQKLGTRSYHIPSCPPPEVEGYRAHHSSFFWWNDGEMMKLQAKSCVCLFHCVSLLACWPLIVMSMYAKTAPRVWRSAAPIECCKFSVAPPACVECSKVTWVALWLPLYFEFSCRISSPRLLDMGDGYRVLSSASPLANSTAKRRQDTQVYKQPHAARGYLALFTSGTLILGPIFKLHQ